MESFSSSNSLNRKNYRGFYTKSNPKKIIQQTEEKSQFSDKLATHIPIDNSSELTQNYLDDITEEDSLNEKENQKEEIKEILKESHEAYLNNRQLKKELKKVYSKDKKKRKKEYQMKRDKLGFVGFVIHFIGFIPIFPFVGMILGAIALARIRNKKSNYTGTTKYALWALIGGFLATITSVFVWILINRDLFWGGFL